MSEYLFCKYEVHESPCSLWSTPFVGKWVVIKRLPSNVILNYYSTLPVSLPTSFSRAVPRLLQNKLIHIFGHTLLIDCSFRFFRVERVVVSLRVSVKSLILGAVHIQMELV